MNTRMTPGQAYACHAFGKNIKRLRRRAGLTEEKLGEAIGVSRSCICKWERGDNAPKLANIYMLPYALGCTFNDLFGGES